VVRQTFQLSRLQMHTHHFTLLIWTCVLTGLARPWLPPGRWKTLHNFPWLSCFKCLCEQQSWQYFSYFPHKASYVKPIIVLPFQKATLASIWYPEFGCHNLAAIIWLWMRGWTCMRVYMFVFILIKVTSMHVLDFLTYNVLI
jgi:hypothetical protein